MKKAIICIDDENIILDSLVEQLGYELGDDFIIETAESAHEGFEVIDDLVKMDMTILLIISDWLMPGMKGDQFLVKIHEKYPNIVKIMLTGQADKESIDNAVKNAKIYRCVPKPWDKNLLIETIRKGLESIK